MALLNCDLPFHFYAFLRAEFVHNLEDHHGEFIPCVVFGAASQRNRAISFHVMLDDGAQFARMPIHAICMKEGAAPMPLPDLAMWDCFGDRFTVTAFSYLKDMEVVAKLPSGLYSGIYLMSFDWLDNGFSDEPSQHKTMHLISLDNGNLAFQPNNTCRWVEKAFTDRAFEPTYKTNTHKWWAEESPRGDES